MNINELDLLYVSTEEEDPTKADPTIIEGGNTDPDPKEPDNDPKPIQMTQEEFDKAIEARLKRDREKREREAELQRMEEQKEFEELAVQLKAENEALKAAQKLAELDALKTQMIVAAGYDNERMEFIKSIVNGENEEELQTSLATVIENVPPVKPYGDPNPNNGRGNPPPQKKDSEYGRELYERIRRK